MSGALDAPTRDRAINIGSIALISVVAIFLLIIWLTQSGQFISPQLTLLLIATGVSGQLFVRLNRPTLAAWSMLTLSMLSMFYMASFGIQGRIYALAGYIIVMCMAIVLLPRLSWLIILVVAMAATIFASLQAYVATPEIALRSFIVDASLSISYLLVAATTVGILYSRIGHIIASTKQANRELAKANEALRRSNSHNRVVMETVVDPFFLVNGNLEIIDCNQRACDMLGFTHAEFQTMTIDQIDPATPREVVVQAFREMDEIGYFASDYAEAQTKDGRRFRASVSGRNITFENERQYYIVVRDISEQFTRAEELREQKERLQLIHDNIPVRLALFDTDLNVRYYNATTYATHFQESDSPSTLKDFVGEDGFQEIAPYFEQALSGETAHYERTMETSDGSLISFVQLNPHLVDGQVAGVFATGIDVTALKTAQAELANKTALLETITANLPARISYFDKDSTLQFANQAFRQTYSIAENELPVLDGKALLVGQARQIHTELIARSLETKREVTIELEEQLPSGKQLIARKTCVPHIIDGEVVGCVMLAVDITELRQTQEKLQHSNDIFDLVINNIPARISYMDRAGNIIFVNDRVEEAFGISAENAVKSSVEQILPQAYRDAIAPYVRQAFRSKREVVFESPLTLADGTTIIERSHYYPHVINGRTEALFAINMDVSELRKTEDALEQAHKLESLGLLAGGIAHDFNNLLTAMLGQTSLAMARLEDAHPARRHVEQAVAASKRAATLTQQMLAYSGRGSFSIEWIDLNELIENNLRLFAISIPDNVQLRTELHANLPPIEADVAQMQQLIMNMIINAGQAIGTQNGKIVITTRVEHVTSDHGEYWEITGDPIVSGHYVMVEVQDNGRGMSSETMSRIFDPFFTTKEEGSGLGLAAALGIIRGHKGGIRLDSEVGRGTSFQLMFPAIDRTISAEKHPSQSTAALSPLDHRKVLVIDDEQNVFDVVGDMLALHGIGSLTASSGAAGLALYKQHQDDIAVVLLDLKMPGMNGEETFNALRSVNPEVRVILSSGYSEAEATRLFVGQGLADFLQKPYDYDTLISKVGNVLERC